MNKKRGNYKICVVCKEPYWAYPYNFKKRLYCSIKCAVKINGKKQSDTKKRISKQKIIDNGTFPTRFHHHLYKEWRNECMARDKFTCKECKRTLKPRQLIVHHIKSWEDAPELRVEISNGITLCRGCHNKIHILPNRKENHGF